MANGRPGRPGRRAGSFLTADVAGEPVIVVRGEDKVVRAFFNVCRHRAAPILNEPCGTATKLRCRYHGWTYDLAGKLRGTPEFDGVAGVPQGGQRPGPDGRRGLGAVRLGPSRSAASSRWRSISTRCRSGLSGRSTG